MTTSMTAFHKTIRNSLPLAGMVLVIIYCLLGLSLFHKVLSTLISQLDNSDYTYCYFIPVIIAYLIYEKRKLIKQLNITHPWFGIIPLTFGILMYWLGELGGEYYTLYLSLLFIIIGITMLHIGCNRTKSLIFIFILIMAMFPFPVFVYSKLSVNLQLISSQIGTAMVQLVGLPVYREGNIIDLGFRKLHVVDACSGLRYLMPLMVLGLIVAYFVKGSFWKKILLVFSTIPLAIFMNGIRIALAAISAAYLRPEISDGILHDFSGFVFFMASFGLLVGEVIVLGKLGKPFGKASDASKLKDPQSIEERHGEVEAAPYRVTIAGKRAFPWQPQSAVVLFLLLSTLILSHGINFSEIVPIKKPFAQFPLDVKTWHGKRAFLDADTLAGLYFSDYTIIDYVSPEGKLVSLYVAYWQSQSKGESIHSPETCLPASGWLFTKEGLINFPVPERENGLTVNRAVFEKLNERQVAYYWFPLRGRILHNIWQLKFFNFWDALTMQRTDGALVRIITPLSKNEDAQIADKRLQEFTCLIFPVLRDFLPGRSAH
ncbi:MAG: VPLPA-CTERM-specific exosortase XrtD [Syntrophobacteraceae bacterium]